jgi:hypothetical protein
VVLMSGSLKALTLRQLNYASASRSTEVEQGRQQHEIAEAKCTLANYPRTAILVNSLRVFEPNVSVRRFFRCGVARRNDFAEVKPRARPR